MRKISIVFVVALFVLFYSACKHPMVEPGTSTATVAVTHSDSVCFQSQILPLYQTYCASSGCHDAGTREEGVQTTEYFYIMQGIRANNTGGSRYYTEITRGKMPPRNRPQLSSDQIALIAKWINQGAKNTVCSSGTCDTTKFTYSNSIAAIFATNCNGCHGSSGYSGGVSVSSYSSAVTSVTNLQSNFLNAINYTSASSAKNMPPAGKLSDCQIQLITKWINQGMPQ